MKPQLCHLLQLLTKTVTVIHFDANSCVKLAPGCCDPAQSTAQIGNTATATTTTAPALLHAIRMCDKKMVANAQYTLRKLLVLLLNKQ